jgi:glutathione S-transferase
MITLYHSAMSRSIRPRWLMEEMGIPYTLHHVELGHAAPEGTGGEAYRKVYQLQKLPALDDNGLLLVESTAILEYLAGKYGPTPLSAKPGDDDYGHYLQWLHFGEAGMGGYMNMLLGHTLLLPEKIRNPKVADWAEGELMKQVSFLSEGLGDNEFVLERGFSVADISLGYMLFLLKLMRKMADTPAPVQAYWERLIARPSWAKASAK